jgi:hypothetical protein
VIGCGKKGLHLSNRIIDAVFNLNMFLHRYPRSCHFMNGGFTGGAGQSVSAFVTVKRISFVVWGMRA